MSPKLFVVLLAVLAVLYFSGLGCGLRDDGRSSTALPESAFVEDLLGGLLARFRDPLPAKDLTLDQRASSPGVRYQDGRLHIPAGESARVARLRIAEDVHGDPDRVRCAELSVAAMPAGAALRLLSRYWDLENVEPGPLPLGWEQRPPPSFDPEALRAAQDQPPGAVDRPTADDALRLAVRRRGGVLDVRVSSATAVSLELRP